MADLGSLYDQHKNLSEEAQKKAGQSPAGPMGDEHTNFVKTISRMITEGEINVYETSTFYNSGAYEAIKEGDRGTVDLSMVNIASLLKHIADFYLSKKTPDAAPQLQQMIEELWQMKAKLEAKYGDILKF
ncbi:MAG: hypothetical protein WCS85_01225 [Candidatus Peribacteraceae bacterium]|jgi:hypothetical protein